MRKHGYGAFAAALVLLLCAGLALCAQPRTALAADVEIAGGSLADHLSEGTSLRIIGPVAGCSIPDGITVTVAAGGSLGMDGCTNAGTLAVSGGSVTGNFFNTGSITGASGCTGTIYNTGSVSGSGNIRVPGAAASGASEVIYSDLSSEGAVYRSDTLWIPEGKTIAYLVIGKYICAPNGARLSYTITYRYNNAKQSLMTLDAAKYPSSYYIMTEDQTISEAPDLEVDYVFKGWYCDALGITEANLSKTLTIPAGTTGNLELVSWWDASPGHNENTSGAITGMSSGGGKGGSTSGTLGAAAGGVLLDDEDDADSAVANVLTGENGGVRVRTASSVQRHTFKNAQSSEEIEAMAGRRKSSRFPWQWVGVGLGGALILFAVGATLRRKLNERNAATLEKLNIHD